MMVHCVNELEVSDHIHWERLVGYKHHAIVQAVDYESGEIEVIEYGSDGRGFSLGKGVVRTRTVSDVQGMYKHVYIDECDDPDTVLRRAKSRLGVRNYEPFTNNCEHYATWCKTGREESSQVLPFLVKTVLGAVSGNAGGFGTATGRYVATCAAEAAKNGTTIPTEIKCMLTCGSPKDVLNEACRAVAGGGKAVGQNTLKSCCKAGVLGVASIAIEGGLFYYTYRKIEKEYRNNVERVEHSGKSSDEVARMKQLLEQQRNRDIKIAGCEALGGAIVGTFMGVAIGSFVPVLGTAVFAALGNGIGRLVGKTVYEWLCT